jgi:hypothetical protein
MAFLATPCRSRRPRLRHRCGFAIGATTQADHHQTTSIVEASGLGPETGAVEAHAYLCALVLMDLTRPVMTIAEEWNGRLGRPDDRHVRAVLRRGSDPSGPSLLVAHPDDVSRAIAATQLSDVRAASGLEVRRTAPDTALRSGSGG